MTQKSILEEALLQVQNLEEVVKQNAKGIIASTMRQELKDLLKEKEQGKGISEQEDEDDMLDQPEEGDDTENLDDLDNEDPTADSDLGDTDLGDTDLDEPDLSDDLPIDDESIDDDEVLDMTDASDDEILKVFKAMKPEDGIVVKKDGDDIEVDTGDDEYIIKLDDEGDEGGDLPVSDELAEQEGDDEWGDDETISTDELSDEEDFEIFPDDELTADNDGGDEFSDDVLPTSEEGLSDDETVYEIELDEEDDLPEEELPEAARTATNPHGNKGNPSPRRPGLKSKKMYKAGSEPINEELTKLKKQNQEYKKALVLFKEKLNEVAVFNANLAYSTRLFTENSTTKQEKLDILKRFDNVSTLNESKQLYNTIAGELKTKKPVTESVADKIVSTPSSSSSEKVLSEAKAYENPQFKRMKELMTKII